VIQGPSTAVSASASRANIAGHAGSYGRSVTTSSDMTPTYVTRFTVDDRQLSALHARAFGTDPDDVQPWARQLDRHALTWIGAFEGEQLTGFVQVAWDGRTHAFLLDTAVHPDHQHQGIGTGLISTATAEARAAGCTWLHVDFEPHLDRFYLDTGGFRPTPAGLRRLA
jgi:ribosomal protein S18 acetylase RimI-like enzyme